VLPQLPLHRPIAEQITLVRSRRTEAVFAGYENLALWYKFISQQRRKCSTIEKALAVFLLSSFAKFTVLQRGSFEVIPTPCKSRTVRNTVAVVKPMCCAADYNSLLLWVRKPSLLLH
jgi:hypothetical protein